MACGRVVKARVLYVISECARQSATEACIYINKLNMILYFGGDEQGLISNRIYLSFPLCTPPHVNQICKLFCEHG